MPAWAPGDYEIFNYGKSVESIEFRRGGAVVASSASDKDPNLWRIPGGADEAVYTVKPSRGNFSPNLRVSATQAFASGPGVFGWFEGDQANKQQLDVDLLPAGAKAYSTLDPVTPGQQGKAAQAAFLTSVFFFFFGTTCLSRPWNQITSAGLP